MAETAATLQETLGRGRAALAGESESGRRWATGAGGEQTGSRGSLEKAATPVAAAGSDLSRRLGAHAPMTANDSSGGCSVVMVVYMARLVTSPVEHSPVTGSR